MLGHLQLFQYHKAAKIIYGTQKVISLVHNFLLYSLIFFCLVRSWVSSKNKMGHSNNKPELPEEPGSQPIMKITVLLCRSLMLISAL